MRVIQLYKYAYEGNYTVVSPRVLDGEVVGTLSRLIADSGMILTNGSVYTRCVDLENTDGWVEVEAPTPNLSERESQYIDAARILLGEEA